MQPQMYMRRVIQRAGMASVVIVASVFTLTGTNANNTLAIDVDFSPATMPGSVPQVAGTAGAEIRDPAKPTLSRLDLAIMHLDYLFLDEVVAGRSGVITSEVEMAIALLDYLLLPEVGAPTQ